MTDLSPRVIPKEVSSQLPIFQILGGALPEKMKSPEAKKVGSTIVFILIALALVYGFFKVLPTLLAFAQMTVLLVIFSIFAIVLIMLAPKIIKLLHGWGEIMLFKSETRMAQRYGIETLELQLRKVEEARDEVRARITQVEGVRINMRTSAEKQQDESTTAYEQVKKFVASANEKERLAKEKKEGGYTDAANQLSRDVKEVRLTATTRKAEGDAAAELARTYAQYANQFGKAIEILRDNELAAKMYANLLSASVRIVRKKLEATNAMRRATEGLADIFQVEDKWIFQTAMDAVTVQIDNNIGSIKRNLSFLNENRLEALGTGESPEELDTFVKQLNEGNIQKLNVTTMSDAAYDWKTDEKADKAFSILD